MHAGSRDRTDLSEGPSAPRASSTDEDSPRAAPPEISLPKGGGAIRGIDEKFSVNPATGTGSLSIPLPWSPGRSGLTPPVSLSYDSGAGNGPFGLGWSLSLPIISRKTDKTLPRYWDDGADADVYLLSGAEDLVPKLVPDGSGWRAEAFDRDGHQVLRFRPRVEGGFHRIERWTRPDTGDVHWRVTSGDNVTQLFGLTASARLSDPAEESRVLQWMIEEIRDDKGNIVRFEYKPEDVAGLDLADPSERNRLAANRYLKRVLYANQTPFQPDGWHFHAVLDYGEHDVDDPLPDEASLWTLRPDSFSSFRAGFDLRTRRLCRRFLMFHRFDELGPGWTPVRSVDFSYDQNPVLTKLTDATQTGYLKKEGVLSRRSYPPLSFTYTVAGDPVLRELDGTELGNIDGVWADLDGEGLSGRLSTSDGVWRYRANRGKGRFAPEQRVETRPSMDRLAGGRQQLLDLAGKGTLDLVDLEGPVPGFQERRAGAWSDFRPFPSLPTISWNDPQLRFIDLDGDGRSDVLITENDVFSWHASLGEEGFGPAQAGARPQEEEDGPLLVFADGDQSVYLADMSGDGLTDLVRIRNGEVSYWPNLGYGRFGSKVAMHGAPVLDAPDLFRQDRIRLVDVDGSGTADVLFLGRDAVRVWPNEAGNGFGPAQEIPFPTADPQATVTVTDLLGNGTACLVWASAAPRDALSPWRCVDLTGGVKPHLLNAYRNNLGAETRLAYAPSTRFYLADLEAGSPWVTRLPFPVQVVERVETFDEVSGGRFVTSYSYHHGFYDGKERELCGFGRVDTVDTETFPAVKGAGLFAPETDVLEEASHIPPVLTKTWLHTGAFAEEGDILGRFRTEFYAGDGHPQAAPLPSPLVPEGLTAVELGEAHRALKTSLLRTEVYALDGTPEAAHPYAVTEWTYEVAGVQPRGVGRHGVFVVQPRESLNIQYERRPEDPRVVHDMTLEVDPFGQPRKTATVAYGRRAQADHPGQKRQWISYGEKDLVNKPDEESWYRLGLPAESRTHELILSPPPGGARFRWEDMKTAADGGVTVPYETEPLPGQKRMVARQRTQYWKDDLSGPLPWGEAESRALVRESHSLALTTGMVSALFDGRVTDPMLSDEGGYASMDGGWWIPAGRRTYDPARFYMATAFQDPFGNVVSVSYDPYALLIVRTDSSPDPVLNNVIEAENDYRMLGPRLITDPNGNRSAAAFDELGLVSASALMGKSGQNEGDTLEAPTVLHEYHLWEWVQNGRPVWARTLVRETHGAPDTRWRDSRLYADGFGRKIQTKAQAEPGLAPQRDPAGELVKDAQGNVVLAHTADRWAGSGRTVHNNKGLAIRQFQPFFSSTPGYEEEEDLTQTGPCSLVYYDPMERVVRTENPDGTLSRTLFSAWQHAVWDANDTVQESRWYDDRKNLPPGDPERRAADLAVAHDGTPVLLSLDAMDRPFVSLADNGAAGQYLTHTSLDAQGNVLKVTDHQQRDVMVYGHDMMGRRAYQRSVDAGERWTLLDAAGNAIRAWNSRGHEFRTTYDPLRRPTASGVKAGPGPERVFTVTEYGESHPQAQHLNLRGRVLRVLDGAGAAVTERVDFKGNVLERSRRMLQDPALEPDWSAAPALEDAAFSSAIEYDAVNRPTLLTAPDQSRVRLSYNVAGFPEGVSVERPGEAERAFVKAVEYDAKGQRSRIAYGNGVETTYAYDPMNLRLVRVRTDRADGAILQDLIHTFDPAGNVVEIRDGAQQSVFFNNAVVSADLRYVYDPLYRLTRAEGREHVGQGASPQVDHDDQPRTALAHPHDGQALRRYAEEYTYEAVGNLLSVAHQAVGGNWTRRYQYEPGNNRLTATSRPGDPPGTFSDTYPHDAHGNMTRMPHLAALWWDPADRLRRVDLGGGGSAFYQYDAEGQRVRKAVQRQNGLVQERLYLDGFEIYRERQNGNVRLERTSLHVSDGARRIAVLETRTIDVHDPGATPQSLARFQLDNHLGSACLELDESGAIVSYEEFHPYGSTAYQAGPSAAQVSLKRYRYIGKERDEETSLYYHGARYYAPWIARWTAADPSGIEDGVNAFAYGRNNPIVFVDPDGKKNTPRTAADRTVMMMTDPQLHAHMKALDPVQRQNLISGATGAFANRAMAMATRYDMKRVYQLEEITIQGDLPGKGKDTPVPVTGGDPRKLSTSPEALADAGVFFMPDNTARIGTPIHAVVLPILQARLAKHGIPSLIELDTLPGGSKSGKSRGEIDLVVLMPPAGAARKSIADAHLYDLKPGGSPDSVAHLEQVRKYVQFFDPAAVPELAVVNPQLGTVLYQVQAKHPDVLKPVEVPGTAGEVRIMLQLKGPGIVEYHLGVSPKPPPGVPVEVRKRRPDRYVDDEPVTRFFLVHGEAATYVCLGIAGAALVVAGGVLAVGAVGAEATAATGLTAKEAAPALIPLFAP